MNTYTHFLWAIVLSRWILARTQTVENDGNNDDNDEEAPQQHSNSDNRGDEPTTTRNPRAAPDFDRKGALLGSVLPDLPLIATTFVCILLDYFDRDDSNDDDGYEGSWTGTLFDEWYFSNPWVIAEHSIFHSPVSLLFFILLTYLWYARNATKESNSSVTTTTTEQHQDIEALPTSNDAFATELQQQQQRKPGCCYSCWGPSSYSAGIGSSRFWFWVFVSAMFHALCDIPVHHDDGPLVFWPLNRTYRFVSPVSYWDPNYHGTPFSIVEHLLDLIIVVDLVVRFCRRRRHRNQQRWCCPEKKDDDDNDANDDGTTKRLDISENDNNTISA